MASHSSSEESPEDSASAALVSSPPSGRSSDEDLSSSSEPAEIKDPILPKKKGKKKVKNPSPAEGKMLQDLLRRITLLERRQVAPARAPRLLFGGQTPSAGIEILEEVKRDPTRIPQALTKARKPFARRSDPAFVVSSRDQELVDVCVPILSDLKRAVVSLSALADFIEEGKGPVDLQAVADTVNATVTLLTLDSQALRLRLWKAASMHAAPSIRRQAADVALRDHWREDDYTGFLRDLLHLEQEARNTRVLETVLRPPRQHRSGDTSEAGRTPGAAAGDSRRRSHKDLKDPKNKGNKEAASTPGDSKGDAASST
jgi:hypothetical protein